MSEFKVVSRKDLFDDEIVSKDRNEYDGNASHIDLEIIEVNGEQEFQRPEIQEKQEEFEFPLFSFGGEQGTANSDEGTENEVKLMKVTLGELPNEIIKQERPKSYYTAIYSKEDLRHFSESAIDNETIFKDAKLGPYKGWGELRGKVIDVSKHNAGIENFLRREEKLRKRRPSKKQRLARKLGAEREKLRDLKAKEIKRMIKKRFHKRGGKKNKKTTNASNSKLLAPKFRTE